MDATKMIERLLIVAIVFDTAWLWYPASPEMTFTSRQLDVLALLLFNGGLIIGFIVGAINRK